MGKVKLGFFSFTEITDPAEHRSYNEWHQLDHMPEQIPLPGIVHGQRWVSTPACRAARQVSGPLLDPIHYLTLYLMSEPEGPALEEFRAWGERLALLGRFHRHRRAHLAAPFLLVKGYAAPRVRISPEAVPFRPHRGVHVTVQELAEATGLDPWLQWHDRVHLPELLDLPGVAGAWVFASRAERGHDHPEGRRITVVFLDGPPRDVCDAMVEAESAEWSPPPRTETMRTLFAGPFETITPWEWGWFDGDPAGSRGGAVA